MKNLYSLILLILIYNQGTAQNLITNGNFETGDLTGWSGNAHQVVTDNGSFVGNNNNGDSSSFQVVNVIPGETYDLTFDYRWVSGSGDYNLTANIKENASNPGSSLGTFVCSITPDVWHTDGAINFTAPLGVTQVRVIFWKPNGNRPFRFDNVRIVKEGSLSSFLIDENTPEDIQPLGIPGNWDVSFSDEFNGTASPVPNSDRWVESVSANSRAPRAFQGIDDWWWRADHVSINGLGQLELKASKFDNNTMYCGSVESKGFYEPTYGYLEARIEIADTKKGNHTALWLQGHNQENIDGTGNDGAEVDIFESAWENDTTKAVVHIDGYGVDKQANTKSYNTPNIHSGYHIFGLLWEENSMKIYYDGELKVSYAGKWVPNVPEWLWLSVGASFGDGEFKLQPIGELSVAKVDWVRYYKPSSATLSNEDFEFKNDKRFLLFPNPTHEKLFIKSIENTNYSVVIYNQDGKILYKSLNNDKTLNIDVSKYSKGLYFVKIQSQDKANSYPILIN